MALYPAPRLRLQGEVHHVALRGMHGQPVFLTRSDRQILDQLVGEVLREHAARAHAYCWMTNHLHMVVQVDHQPLGRLMRSEEHTSELQSPC